ncbi:hypothetical protein MHH33_16960 [Paenisporosarcina sp. FSL H8-0542]|uniref:hypothetical protein n=1 Tax=Paenisporosarcina sp. FSL H8-0542 TaxID=2921401 RepID=UPI001E556327|nr:hypothetical protein [Paenisporosarcina sp. HGH0030]
MNWLVEDIVFETMLEADVWADSLVNEIYGRNFNGYITTDYKIACAMAFRLATARELRVFTSEDEPNRYKVWVEFHNQE